MQLELAINREGTLYEQITWTVEHRDCGEATKLQHLDHRRWLIDFFGDVALKLITFPEVLRYIQEEGPEGRGIMKVSVKKRLVTLRMALEDGYRRGLLDRPPDWWPDIESDSRPGQDLWTYDQWRQGRLAFEPGQRIAIDILFWTGMHLSDVRRWKRADVNLVDGTWRRFNTKSKAEPVWLPLPVEFRAILEEWFLSDGISSPGLRVAPQLWTSPIKPIGRVCFRAGLPRITPLGLRRSCVSYQFELGAKKGIEMKRLGEWVALWLGHKGSPETSSIIRRHYLRWTPEAIRLTNPF